MSRPVFDLQAKRVWVAGHRGMVGSAVVRALEHEPIGQLITATSTQLDLRRQADTESFVMETRPDLAILAAARVGGIQANRSAQAEFLYDNLMIAANCLEACRLAGVAKVVVLGSSCIYPRDSPQPIREDYLLTGPLEETNEGYAIAKIAALELGKMQRRQYGADVVSLMPTNLYGPGDNYDLRTSHVLPALIRKTHEAKVTGAPTIEIWGSGTPRREFLHVDDLAQATLHAARWHSGEEHLNVGTGTDLSIRELAQLIAGIIGWDGTLVFDPSMPDGTPRKLLDVSRLRSLGWQPSVDLADGITSTYQAFLVEHADAYG
jgi:GDP-L-fucose synthase